MSMELATYYKPLKLGKHTFWMVKSTFLALGLHHLVIYLHKRKVGLHIEYIVGIWGLHGVDKFMMHDN